MRFFRSCLLLLPLSAALLGGCKDGEVRPVIPPYRPKLPPETTLGANAMGALVNDTIWEAANQPGVNGVSASPNAIFRNQRLSIFAYRLDQVNSPAAYFNFELYGVTGPGVYALGPQIAQGGVPRYAIVGTLQRGVSYETDSAATGTLTVTRLDTTGRRPFVSGRFELRARKVVALTADPAAAATLPAEVRVVSGRFDVEFNRL